MSWGTPRWARSDSKHSWITLEIGRWNKFKIQYKWPRGEHCTTICCISSGHPQTTHLDYQVRAFISTFDAGKKEPDGILYGYDGKSQFLSPDTEERANQSIEQDTKDIQQQASGLINLVVRPLDFRGGNDGHAIKNSWNTQQLLDIGQRSNSDSVAKFVSFVCNVEFFALSNAILDSDTKHIVLLVIMNTKTSKWESK